MTSPTESGIEDRLTAVRARVEEAARAAGRGGADSRVAVSKGQPAEAIRAADVAGQRDIG
jgi:uncharacterized pyridoxal phosphate-containing UPF0001 family protein